MSAQTGHEHHEDELHLPHGSIWPVLVALGITALGVGIVLGGPATVIGLVILLATLYGWILEDHKFWNEKIGTGEAVGRMGILFFMSSEVLLFGSLFATYFSFRASAVEWPDQDVHLPLVKTGIFSIFLLSSSWTIHQAEKHLKNDNRRGFLQWWTITVLFGAIFLYGQVDEYLTLIHEGVTLSSGHFATTFYMITGTHGLHVLGGLIFLIIVLVRGLKGQFNSKRHLAPQAAALYWHFVDAIWIIVFTALYIVQ